MTPLLCGRTHCAEHMQDKAVCFRAARKQTHPLSDIFKDLLFPTIPHFVITHSAVNPSVEGSKHPHDSHHLSKCHQIWAKTLAHILSNYNEYQPILCCLNLNVLSSLSVCSHHQQLPRSVLIWQSLELDVFFLV